jgi:phage terminase large subunit-like protein
MATATIDKPRAKARGKAKVTAKWHRLLSSLPGYDPFDQGADCWFEPEIAQYYIDFIEECCTHVEGDLAGEPFILERWEKAIVANLFGWQRIDAYGRQVRRYRFVFIYVPRKNGKTPLVAAIVNAIFFLDDEYRQKNFCAAADTEQADELFSHIAGMIKNEANMEARCREYTSFKTILKLDDHSKIKVISAAHKTKHGKNPHVIAVDELHAQPDRRLMDVFQSSFISKNRKQPLFFMITTADFKRDSVCNEKYERAKNVRDNKGDKKEIGYDPEFLPVIYEADPEANWKRVSTWRKANPNLDVSVSIDFMKTECKRACETPTYENTFKRLHLNIQTEQDVRWLPADLWDSCDFAVDEESLKGKSCYAGFDLSTNTDVAGYAMLFGPDDDCDKWRVLPRFYIPADNAEKREDRDKVPYLTWAREGLITLTAGNVIDYDRIKADFEADCQTFNMVEIAFDRWNFEGPRQRFIADGAPAEKFVAFGQGFASMSAPSKELEKLLLAKELAHGGHPVLKWMAGNVAVEEDAAGNIKPSKKSSKEKIDGIVMLVMALGRAMQAAAPKESVYEKRGVLEVG